MTETELTKPMNFDETNFFILSTNPAEAAKVVVVMDSIFLMV